MSKPKRALNLLIKQTNKQSSVTITTYKELKNNMEGHLVTKHRFSTVCYVSCKDKQHTVRDLFVKTWCWS